MFLFIFLFHTAFYVVIIRGEQMNTGANPTDRGRRHRPDTSADRMSRGRRSEGEARSDVGAV